jgi:hypothetical protein
MNRTNAILTIAATGAFASSALAGPYPWVEFFANSNSQVVVDLSANQNDPSAGRIIIVSTDSKEAEEVKESKEEQGEFVDRPQVGQADIRTIPMIIEWGGKPIVVLRVSDEEESQFSAYHTESPFSTAARLHGDLNGDGLVNMDDLLIVLSEWGQHDKDNPSIADIAPLGRDNVVDYRDLAVVLANWGDGQTPGDGGRTFKAVFASATDAVKIHLSREILAESFYAAASDFSLAVNGKLAQIMSIGAENESLKFDIRKGAIQCGDQLTLTYRRSNSLIQDYAGNELEDFELTFTACPFGSTN